jgi:hypothetical protein
MNWESTKLGELGPAQTWELAGGKGKHQMASQRDNRRQPIQGKTIHRIRHENFEAFMNGGRLSLACGHTSNWGDFFDAEVWSNGWQCKSVLPAVSLRRSSSPSPRPTEGPQPEHTTSVGCEREE